MRLSLCVGPCHAAVTARCGVGALLRPVTSVADACARTGSRCCGQQVEPVHGVRRGASVGLPAHLPRRRCVCGKHDGRQIRAGSQRTAMTCPLGWKRSLTAPRQQQVVWTCTHHEGQCSSQCSMRASCPRATLWQPHRLSPTKGPCRHFLARGYAAAGRRHRQRGAAGQPVLRGRAASAGPRRGVRRAAGGAAGGRQAALRQQHPHPPAGARFAMDGRLCRARDWPLHHSVYGKPVLYRAGHDVPEPGPVSGRVPRQVSSLLG